MVLTKKHLLDCFRNYREAFPDWAVEHDVVLSRVNGAVRQQIGFQALRTGAYRPSCSIQVLLVPEFCYVLQQWLDVKHREVSLREHATKWPSVVKAMEEQFLPPIRNPLSVVETLRLAEEDTERNGIDNLNNSTGLAALNAYQGNLERALYWCDRVKTCSAKMERQLGEWEVRKVEFVTQLLHAIDEGRERMFLASAQK